MKDAVLDAYPLYAMHDILMAIALKYRPGSIALGPARPRRGQDNLLLVQHNAYL